MNMAVCPSSLWAYYTILRIFYIAIDTLTLMLLTKDYKECLVHNLIWIYLMAHEHAILMFCWKSKVVMLDARYCEWSRENFFHYSMLLLLLTGGYPLWKISWALSFNVHFSVGARYLKQKNFERSEIFCQKPRL